MATVNFSVPETIKQAFNETFRDQNNGSSIGQIVLLDDPTLATRTAQFD